ncbi:uncharacterized protein DSM5745_00418 [Aspergillus mulundensis]|uniref:Uncharacterized protein n=1 Tax=Aspergillus mulundensis TaxID=1810919 RepID=A0A3D8T3G4_9EURO|nr:hypothetical protein DSM5745_00418 [Aspergillus mulundensis]RDW93096.1 hypothetical protein DSM5745_00418 [Aspergillus mulundensis]
MLPCLWLVFAVLILLSIGICRAFSSTLVYLFGLLSQAGVSIAFLAQRPRNIDRGLGPRSKLSPELCAMVLSSPKPQPRSPPHITEESLVLRLADFLLFWLCAAPDPLAILSAIDGVYIKAVKMLYKGLTIEFDFHPDKSGLYCPRIRIPELGVDEPVFDPKTGKMHTWIKGLHYPFARSIIVNIYPSCLSQTSDPEKATRGLLSLWTRLRELVNILSKVKNIENLIVNFCPSDDLNRNGLPSGWVINNQPRVSLQKNQDPWYTITTNSTLKGIAKFLVPAHREMFDHEVVFLPFCELVDNVTRLDVTFAGVSVSSNERVDLDGDAGGLDWSFHRVAMRHFFNNPAHPRSTEVKKVLRILPLFIAETEVFYRSAMDMIDQGESGRKWRCEHFLEPEYLRLSMDLDAQYGDGVQWTWPGFVLGLDSDVQNH